MLKIKDNVDLKELEKFGFCFNKKINVYVYDKGDDEIIYLTTDIYSHIFVSSTDKCVSFSLDIIYDLIQAGLVEKF